MSALEEEYCRKKKMQTGSDEAGHSHIPAAGYDLLEKRRKGFVLDNGTVLVEFVQEIETAGKSGKRWNEVADDRNVTADRGQKLEKTGYPGEQAKNQAEGLAPDYCRNPVFREYFLFVLVCKNQNISRNRVEKN
jgi:hypothetical protein